MTMKKLKLNEVLLNDKEMRLLNGANGEKGGHRCGCGCGEMPNGYTNAAGVTQENYDQTWDEGNPPD